jgi:hypothetical protein
LLCHLILLVLHTFIKMMTFSSLFLCTLLVATPFAAVAYGANEKVIDKLLTAAHTTVYTAELEPYGDNSQVTGKVVVFAAEDGVNVAYAGSAALLEINATDSTCAEVNGK